MRCTCVGHRRRPRSQHLWVAALLDHPRSHRNSANAVEAHLAECALGLWEVSNSSEINTAGGIGETQISHKSLTRRPGTPSWATSGRCTRCPRISLTSRTSSVPEGPCQRSAGARSRLIFTRRTGGFITLSRKKPHGSPRCK